MNYTSGCRTAADARRRPNVYVRRHLIRGWHRGAPSEAVVDASDGEQSGPGVTREGAVWHIGRAGEG